MLQILCDESPEEDLFAEPTDLDVEDASSSFQSVHLLDIDEEVDDADVL